MIQLRKLQKRVWGLACQQLGTTKNASRTHLRLRYTVLTDFVNLITEFFLTIPTIWNLQHNSSLFHLNEKVTRVQMPQQWFYSLLLKAWKNLLPMCC